MSDTVGMKLTHLTEQGHAHMVDVSGKPETKRTAIAEGFITMQAPTLATILSQRAKKGDVLATARIAGIMAAKRTSDLIPLCHPLMLTNITIDLLPIWGDDAPSTQSIGQHSTGEGECGIHVMAKVSLVGKTGVEMEALTAASIACLTIYDMCKAIDRSMEINGVRVVHKEGGKSGTWARRGDTLENIDQ